MLADNEATQRWNNEYMPLVEANIRSSVNRFFSNYISNDILEKSLDSLSFMSQDDLKKQYGKGFKKGTLGFNNGLESYVDSNYKNETSESHDIKINFAFVTAVHENLHMISTNDSGASSRRGVQIDGHGRAMNEAITEYFTFVSLGGDTPLGGLYPGEYSGYITLMKVIPIIEAAVGTEQLKEAYFQNKPEILEKKIDNILGVNGWNELCKNFDVLQYTEQYSEIGKTAGRISTDIEKIRSFTSRNLT